MEVGSSPPALTMAELIIILCRGKYGLGDDLRGQPQLAPLHAVAVTTTIAARAANRWRSIVGIMLLWLESERRLSLSPRGLDQKILSAAVG